MPLPSCVAHPRNEEFFIIRRAYYELTGKNKLQSIILWTMEYFTSLRRVQMRDLKESGEPWIEKSIEDFNEEIFGFISSRRIPEALAEIEKGGWVKVQKPSSLGKKTRYLFDFKEAQRRIEAWALNALPVGQMSDDDEDPAGQMSDGPQDKCPTAIGQMSELYKEEEFKELNQEQKQEESFPVPEKSLKSFKHPIPPAASYDLQIGTPVVEFVQNAYRQSRGAEKLKKSDVRRLAERIENAEKEYGEEEFRTWLWNYLNKSNQWLRDNKWPFNGFLKDPMAYQYAASEPQSTPVQSQDKNDTWIADAHEQIATAPASDFHNPLLQYVYKWNTLVPSKPIDDSELLVSTKKKLSAAISSEPDFVKHFDKICQKCAKMPQDNDFPWLFANGGGQPNWQGVLEGKFSFLIQKKPLNMMEKMMEKMQADAEAADAEMEKQNAAKAV